MDTRIGFAENQWTVHELPSTAIFEDPTPVLVSGAPESSQETGPHIHDFSIRLDKRKQYRTNIFDSTHPRERPTQKCPDTYVASTCCGDKKWTLEDILTVVRLQNEYFNENTFVLQFPDQEINSYIVKKLNPSIKAVQFLQSKAARYCYVAIKDTSLRDEIIEDVRHKQFGNCGLLGVQETFGMPCPSLDNIDPFTLFIDDIPLTMKRQTLIDMFPNCVQIAVSYTSKIYYIKRYAFIIYRTVEEAICAFKKVNTDSDFIVKFRLFQGSAHFPEESEIKNFLTDCDEGSTLPIFTDPGAPVYCAERDFKVLRSVALGSK